MSVALIITVVYLAGCIVTYLLLPIGREAGEIDGSDDLLGTFFWPIIVLYLLVIVPFFGLWSLRKWLYTRRVDRTKISLDEDNSELDDDSENEELGYRDMLCRSCGNEIKKQ